MSQYTDLITNYHATKPLFFQHVDLSTRPFLDTSTTLNRLVTAFDIDNAVGVQLDILGEWIGRSRYVAVPISGIFFAWDTEGLAMTRACGRGHMILTVGIPRSVTKLIG